MQKLVPSLLMFCLILSSSSVQAELTIEGNTSVAPYKLVRLKATGADAKAAIVWDVSDEEKCDVEEVGKRLLMIAPPGKYRVKCRALSRDSEGNTTVETARTTVTVGDPPTPDPGPGPTPPGPTPTPSPIPLEGFRTLILYESADLAKLPKDQHNALYSKAVQDYLNATCIKEGGTAGWRIWDTDLDTSKAAKHWQDAVKRAKGNKDYKTPYILISNGKTGFEGPFPKNTDDTLALLKKYGPATTKTKTTPKSKSSTKPGKKPATKGGSK